MGFKTEKRENLCLQPTHRSKRLNWANNHKNWTRNNLQRIISSDKTKISIWGSDGIKQCQKKSDNKLQFHYLELTVKHGDSLMVWCCSTCNGHKYASQIFDVTAKKRNYIYNLKTTMKDALNWYGFGSKNVHFLSNIRAPNILQRSQNYGLKTKNLTQFKLTTSHLNILI